MFDAHCHIGFSVNPLAFAQHIAQAGLEVMCVTVTPDEFLHLEDGMNRMPAIHLAAGLHPWWINANATQAQTDCTALLQIIERHSLIGEVGLDFSSSHIHTQQTQIEIFTRIVQKCAHLGNKTLSIHSVSATTQLLDILEQTGCTNTCTCILHWFSGTSDELTRAIALGCYFSVGKRMLATKRGRAYVRAIPQGRLLIETDLPAQASAQESALVSGQTSGPDAGQAFEKTPKQAPQEVYATPINNNFGEKLHDDFTKQEWQTAFESLLYAYRVVGECNLKHTIESINQTAQEIFCSNR